jgi:hypothetical protein
MIKNIETFGIKLKNYYDEIIEKLKQSICSGTLTTMLFAMKHLSSDLHKEVIEKEYLKLYEYNDGFGKCLLHVLSKFKDDADLPTVFKSLESLISARKSKLALAMLELFSKEMLAPRYSLNEELENFWAVQNLFELAAENQMTELLQRIAELKTWSGEPVVHSNAKLIFGSFLKSIQDEDSDTPLKILTIFEKEFAEDGFLREECLSNAFEKAAATNKLDLLRKIWQISNGKLDVRKINDAFESAAREGNTEIVEEVIACAKEKIFADAILSGFKKAIANFNSDTALKILNSYPSKISHFKSEHNELFELAAKKGDVLVLEKLWQLFSNNISKQTIENSLLAASVEDHSYVIEKIFEFVDDNISNDLKYSMMFKALDKRSHGVLNILKNKYPEMFKNVIIAASEYAINNNDKNLFTNLADTGFFVNQKNVKIIGFANYRGEWSQNIINYINKKDAKTMIIRLELEDTKSPGILKAVNGSFILPGAGDSFERNSLGVTFVDYLDKGYHDDHEYAYQNIINYATENDAPLLGICNGAQHLVLNAGGAVRKTLTGHNQVK